MIQKIFSSCKPRDCFVQPLQSVPHPVFLHFRDYFPTGLQDVIADRDEGKWQKCRKVSPKYLWREGQILDLSHGNGSTCQDFQVKAALPFKFKSANSSSAFKMWKSGGLSLCHPVHACCFVWYTKVYIRVCFQIFSSAMESTLKVFWKKRKSQCPALPVPRSAVGCAL